MKEVELYTTYNFECPDCTHENKDILDDFQWNPEKGCYTMQVTCEECGKEFIANKSEY